MSFDENTQAAAAVLDAGTMRIEGQSIHGSYRGHPLVITRSTNSQTGSPAVTCRIACRTRGVRICVSPAQQIRSPEKKVTGDSAFDDRFDVTGAPRSVLVSLLASDPVLRGILFSLPMSTLFVEKDRIDMALPGEHDARVLRGALEGATAIIERLPAAIQRSGALAQSGGRSLEDHPEVRSLERSRKSTRILAFTLIGIFILVPILLSVGCVVACEAVMRGAIPLPFAHP